MKKLFRAQLREAMALRIAMTSQRRLGEESGVNHSVISRFLTGETDLTLENAEKMLRALGLEITSMDAKR